MTIPGRARDVVTAERVYAFSMTAPIEIPVPPASPIRIIPREAMLKVTDAVLPIAWPCPLIKITLAEGKTLKRS